MNFEPEDLDLNPFYKALQTFHLSVYREARARRALICVPTSQSLPSANNDFFQNSIIIKNHILYPSPYYDQEFINDEDGIVSIVQNMITPISGFPDKKPVQILMEEPFYEDSSSTKGGPSLFAAKRICKILVISKPLIGGWDTSEDEDLYHLDSIIPHTYDLEDQMRFLKSFPSNFPILRQIKSAVTAWNQTYILAPGFLSHAKDRLKSIASNGARDIVVATPPIRKMIDATPETSDPFFLAWSSHVPTSPLAKRLKTALQLSTESYVMSLAAEKLLHHLIHELYSEQEKKLSDAILRLKNLSPMSLGIESYMLPNIQLKKLKKKKKKKFQHFSEAITHISQMNSLKSPLEKMECLKNACAMFTSEIEKNMQRIINEQDKARRLNNLDLYLQEFWNLHGQGNPNTKIKELSKSDFEVNADRELSLLTYIIIQAQLEHLFVNGQYMEEFYDPSLLSPEYHYRITQFKGAARVILEEDSERLKQQQLAAKQKTKKARKSTPGIGSGVGFEGNSLSNPNPTDIDQKAGGFDVGNIGNISFSENAQNAIQSMKAGMGMSPENHGSLIVGGTTTNASSGSSGGISSFSGHTIQNIHQHPSVASVGSIPSMGSSLGSSKDVNSASDVEQFIINPQVTASLGRGGIVQEGNMIISPRAKSNGSNGAQISIINHSGHFDVISPRGNSPIVTANQIGIVPTSSNTFSSSDSKPPSLLNSAFGSVSSSDSKRLFQSPEFNASSSSGGLSGLSGLSFTNTSGSGPTFADTDSLFQSIDTIGLNIPSFGTDGLNLNSLDNLDGSLVVQPKISNVYKSNK